MPYEFQHTRRVEFSDTDMAGIMHFSNFFRFMEAAETAFMRSLGLSVVLSNCGLDVCLPRVHAECDYQLPLRFEDEVLIHLLVEKKATRTLTYQFRFLKLNVNPPIEVARGKLVAVCAARQPDGSIKAVALPEAFADKLQEAPAGLLANGTARSKANLPDSTEAALSAIPDAHQKIKKL
ncbi:MAG TPA: thioesterase family protein [Patescibacteria group bacterium]|nr:thioesterase family protein [Patescibacteria group bacterium]